jgi:Trypsin-like peptidase domain
MHIADALMSFFAEKGDRIHSFADSHPAYPLHLVLRATKKLEAAGHLLPLGVIARPGGTAITNAHYVASLDKPTIAKYSSQGRFIFSVDRWPAIREWYIDSVFQLEVELPDDHLDSGTCFVVGDGKVLVTAKHCVENALVSRVFRQGAILSDLNWTTHPDSDLAYCVVEEYLGRPFPLRIPEVLEEVLTMGYPRIPGLHPALVAETAEVSVPIVSVGSVGGFGDGYLDNQRYGLVTAKAKGGNSGGPIIGTDGAAIGVVSMIPELQDDPKLMGYVSFVPADKLSSQTNIALRIADITITSVSQS